MAGKSKHRFRLRDAEPRSLCMTMHHPQCNRQSKKNRMRGIHGNCSNTSAEGRPRHKQRRVESWRKKCTEWEQTQCKMPPNKRPSIESGKQCIRRCCQRRSQRGTMRCTRRRSRSICKRCTDQRTDRYSLVMRRTESCREHSDPATM